jgi:hypothetical protein
VEISDENIQTTTIDPLQTQTKSKAKAKAEAPVDPAALQLPRVASRVGVPPLAVRGTNSIIHADNHSK